MNSGLSSLNQLTPTQKRLTHQELHPMNSSSIQEKRSIAAFYSQSPSIVSSGNEENFRTTNNQWHNPKNSLSKMTH